MLYALIFIACMPAFAGVTFWIACGIKAYRHHKQSPILNDPEPVVIWKENGIGLRLLHFGCEAIVLFLHLLAGPCLYADQRRRRDVPSAE